MAVADFVARLDHIEDGAYLARAWADGKVSLDGWQLEYAGMAYDVPRVPGCTLRRCVAWCEGDEIAYYKGTREREKWTVCKYIHRLKHALETA